MKLNGKTVEIGEGKLIACKFLLLNKYSFQKWKISFAEKQVKCMQEMFERFNNFIHTSQPSINQRQVYITTIGTFSFTQ